MSASDVATVPSTFTILVAEDNEIDKFFLRRAYEKAKLPYRLEFVNDGQRAMEYLAGLPPFSNRKAYPEPDLFLLDIKMPRKNGFEVLEWLRKEGFGHIPVVMLTGSSLDGDREQAKANGAAEFHVKSPSVDETAAMLKEVCARWLKKAA